MKNNFLKKNEALSILLLTFVAFQVSSAIINTGDPSPAAVVATLSTHQADAVRFIKGCFDPKQRKIDYVTVHDVLDHLGKFHESFLELKNVTDLRTQTILDCIHQHIASLPQELQTFLSTIPAEEFDIVMREKQAMQYFHDLLTGPIKRVPQWSNYVDQMAEYLAGNTVYTALRNDLISLRKKSGWFGKIGIARKLNKHKSDIPHKLRTCIETISINELAKRVKN